MNTLATDPISEATMRAVVIPSWGDADQLQTRELPIPEPGLGEVRVAVHAAGLNPVDWVWLGAVQQSSLRAGLAS